MNFKLAGIEAIRGFAAIYVFAGHILLLRGGVEKSSALGYLLRFGQEAVMLFFLVSGFVIYFSTYMHSDRRFGPYFRRRLRRIYPIFLLALAVSFLIGPSSDPTLTQVLGNLSMLQDRDKPGVWFSPLGGNTPLWSLSYEWWFYMAFFPLFAWVRSSRHVHVAGAISIAGFLTYIVLPNEISLFACYFIIWWTGAEIAKLLISGSAFSLSALRLPMSYLSVVTALWGSAVVAHIWAGNEVLSGSHPVVELRHFGSALAFVVVGAAWHKLGWRGFKQAIGPFAIVAPISYGLYALHFPLAVQGRFFDWIPEPSLQVVAYGGTAMLVAYLAEGPLQALVNRVFPVASRETRPGETPEGIGDEGRA
jgi:peptidoglycan/LPS O-acetylase OafA/YrhL